MTSGDPCKRPIPPSNKHSQGGHEARGRIYEQPEKVEKGCFFFAFSLAFLVQSASRQQKRRVARGFGQTIVRKGREPNLKV